jgi:hypothetical protein
VSFKDDSEVDMAAVVVDVNGEVRVVNEGMRLVSRKGRGRVERKMEVSRMKRAVVRMSLGVVSVVVVVGLVSAGVDEESMTTSEGC